MEHTELQYVQNNDVAMLFIHGILGSPQQFKDMAKYMHSLNIDCYCLLLPGHGNNIKKFSACTKDDWIDFVNDRVSSLRSKYKKIVVIGHSMGGLLALKEANEKLVDSIILLNAPIVVNFTLKQHEIGLRVLLGKEKDDDEFIKPYRDAFSINRCNLFECILWVKPFISLLTLISSIKRELEDIKVPTLIIQSKKDETVHYKSAKVIYDKIKSSKKEILMLDKSLHTYYEKTDQEIILSKMKEFVEELVKVI